MIEIKTITEKASHHFDNAVNEALSDGWELVRRECFITGSDRATTFYAELERITEVYEEDESEDTAFWQRTRNPRNPYRCSVCGHTTNTAWVACPKCNRIMRENGE